MKPHVITTPMNINGREFILAEVTRGMGHIGVFRYAATPYTATDVFYVENEPIVRIFDPYTVDPFVDKQIVQISGTEKCSEFVSARLSGAVENFFQYNQELARSAMPVLEMLNPGLYVVHESQMHPADTEGNFFWNHYCAKKTIAGTADKNAALGDLNFTPGYLIPTMTLPSFQQKRLYDLGENVKNEKRLGGIAYHVTGVYSALLKGHHEATAALANDAEFDCIVIEPVTGIIYDSEPNSDKEPKITALSCPYIKIPLEELSDRALERFLVTRKSVKPNAFSVLKPKMNKSVRMVSKRVFPNVVYDNAEQLPNLAILEASAEVDSVTDDQLAALATGEVKYVVVDEEGNEESKYVVSHNYYSSVVAVVNFLQVNDFKRFLKFVVDVLKNDELTSVHKFIAERLLTVMHPTIHDYFSDIAERAEQKDDIITKTARIYVGDWEEHMERMKDDKNNYRRMRKKKNENMQAIAEAKGIATLEAAVRVIDNNLIN